MRESVCGLVVATSTECPTGNVANEKLGRPTLSHYAASYGLHMAVCRNDERRNGLPSAVLSINFIKTHLDTNCMALFSGG